VRQPTLPSTMPRYLTTYSFERLLAEPLCIF
jgi:hypothetical protein